MRTSLRLFAPALRNAAASSRASSSKTKLFVSAVAGGTLAYALVPHKQTLLLESGPSGRRVRSAWEDPPPKPAEVPEEQQSASESPLDGPNEASQAAFDPVTGEINWDCPCLGGMPHGPCGPQFREAFSCFINSEDEPKGINCVEKFKSMQDCFRAHPDVYGEEIDDDDSHKHHGDAGLEDLVKEAETALAEPNSPKSTENVKKFASSTPKATKPVSKETASTPVPTSASS